MKFARTFFDQICEEKKHFQVLRFLLGFVTTVLFFYSIFRRFNIDEFCTIQSAWKLVQGEHVFKDFFEHHHILSSYWITPLVSLFGETFATLIALRLFIFLHVLGIGLITYRISILEFDRRTGLISVILLLATPIFSIHAIEIIPDVPSFFFSILGLYLLLLFLQSNNTKHLVLSALSLAWGFLLLQKAIYIVFACGLMVLAALFKKQISLRSFLIFGCTFFTPIAAYGLYLLFSGNIHAYIFSCWQFCAKMGNGPALHQAFETLAYAYTTNPPLWFFYGIGLFWWHKSFNQTFLAILSIFLICILFIYPYPFQQHLLPALPFVSIIAAATLSFIFNQQRILLSLALLFMVIPPCLGHFVRRVVLTPNYPQWKRMSFVLSVTTNKDYVLSDSYIVDSNKTVCMWYLFRKNGQYFWILPEVAIPTYEKITKTKYHYNVYETIEQFKPKVIDTEHLVRNEQKPLEEIIQHPSIANHYKQSDLHKELFIRID